MTASLTASPGTTRTYGVAKQINIDGHTLLWGASVNNNPTVQDVWNTTPAWSFPFISSELAPMPTATPFINQVYAQQVAGFTGYSFLDDTFYFEFGGYWPLGSNTQQALGIIPTGESPISGIAPYWRVAAEPIWGKHAWEIGTFGLASNVVPMGIVGAGTDSFTDIGIDSQYQYLGDPHTVTARIAWVHENHNTSASQTLGLANNSNNQLRSLNVSVSYIYDSYVEPYRRAGIGWRHRRCGALRHFYRKPEQRRLHLRACLSAIQPRRPGVLAMAEFSDRPAIYALEQIRRGHHEHRRHGEKRQRQQYVLRIHLDYVLTA